MKANGYAGAHSATPIYWKIVCLRGGIECFWSRDPLMHAKWRSVITHSNLMEAQLKGKL